eukprot:2853717-Pleurochrysis_carterae.AAC.1
MRGRLRAGDSVREGASVRASVRVRVRAKVRARLRMEVRAIRRVGERARVRVRSRVESWSCELGKSENLREIKSKNELERKQSSAQNEVRVQVAAWDQMRK